MAKKGYDKYKHSSSEARNLFPRFYCNYIWRFIIGILGLLTGTMSLVIGSWADSGYESLLAISSGPFPNIKVEDMEYTTNVVQLMKYTGWIVGVTFILLAIYSFWTALVLRSLMFVPRPWSKNTWSDLRKAADEILIHNKVRSEPLTAQFLRLNKDQQENMLKYKIPEDEVKVKDAKINS